MHEALIRLLRYGSLRYFRRFLRRLFAIFSLFADYAFDSLMR